MDVEKSLCETCIFNAESYSVCGATGLWRDFSKVKNKCRDYEPIQEEHKDKDMLELWDDRAVQVELNTGTTLQARLNAALAQVEALQEERDKLLEHEVTRAKEKTCPFCGSGIYAPAIASVCKGVQGQRFEVIACSRDCLAELLQESVKQTDEKDMGTVTKNEED